MTKKMPPVPPANRSPKGVGGAPETPSEDRKAKSGGDGEQEARRASIKQNTTHQGYQQDR